MTTNTLPAFVYGTLRPGQGNYGWLLAGNTSSEQVAYLEGASMYSNGGFPYIFEDEDGENTRVTGSLVYIQPEKMDQVMSRMDTLEGTSPFSPINDHNHYNRYKREVVLENGDRVEAWVYMPPKSYHSQIKATLRHVPSGDWMDVVDMFVRS